MRDKIFITSKETENGKKERKSMQICTRDACVRAIRARMRTHVCVFYAQRDVCARAHGREESEPHCRSLAMKVEEEEELSFSFSFGLSLPLSLSLLLAVCTAVLQPGRARRCRWSRTTAFAFFGEVKAVSGKFWWRAVRSLARSLARSFARLQSSIASV